MKPRAGEIDVTAPAAHVDTAGAGEWHEIDPDVSSTHDGVPVHYVAFLLIFAAACVLAALAIRTWVPASAATLGRCAAPLKGEVLSVQIVADSGGGLEVQCLAAKGRAR